MFIPLYNKTLLVIKHNIVNIGFIHSSLTILLSSIFEYYFSIKTCNILSIILIILHLPLFIYYIFITI